jgi:activating signal cointegrator 1
MKLAPGLQAIEAHYLSVLRKRPAYSNNRFTPIWDDLSFGCAVALADLTDCIRMTPTFIDEQPQTEIDTGDWRVGRFAWKLENIRRIMPPIRVTGRQGLFNAEVELPEEKLEAIA